MSDICTERAVCTRAERVLGANRNGIHASAFTLRHKKWGTG